MPHLQATHARPYVRAAHDNNGIVFANGNRPVATPLLLAMSIDSKTLVVADSLPMISIFAVGTSGEPLTLAGMFKARSRITTLAITEGGSTVLFVEDHAPATLKMFNTSNPTAVHEPAFIVGGRAQVQWPCGVVHTTGLIRNSPMSSPGIQGMLKAVPHTFTARYT
ncbi:hypothetical protein FGB62_48g120 [Gracilaria domingensis]|nr:hypothetical protein FGB62_48g120 [Gracilaria domingensis]